MKSLLPATLATATLVFTGTALAQTDHTAAPPAASAASIQAQADRNADADMSSASAIRPKTGMEARMTGVSAGTVVQTPAGESLGTVKDIVPNPNSGQPDFVLIATRAGTAAVPYAAVTPLFHDGHIVLERPRLEGAPRISEDQLQDANRATAEWKKQANRYWGSGNPGVMR
jgi:hypothetical protein